MTRHLSRRDFVRTVGAGAALGVALHGELSASVLPRGPRGSMRIGIIGSGAMGGATGLQWARAGHEILFSSRNPQELGELVAQAGSRARAGYPQDAATFGQVVLIAVPYGALPQ